MPHYGTNRRLQGFDYSSQRTFLVTFTVRNRRPVFATPCIGSIAKEVLLTYRERAWYWLLAYCVMPDHIHLLLRLRDTKRSLARIVATLKCQIIYQSRRAGVIVEFQWGYHDWVLRAHQKPNDFAKYVLANPIRAGLARQPADYPFAGIIDSWF